MTLVLVTRKQAKNIFSTIATGDEYADAAELLLESLRPHADDLRVIVACLGWAPTLRDRFSQSFEFAEFWDLEPALPPESAIRRKPSLVRRIMDDCAEDSVIVYTDADHIVLRGLDEMYSELHDFDVALRHRPEHSSRKMRFAAGLVCMKNSDCGRSIANFWLAAVNRSPSNWWIDQASLPGVEAFSRSIGAKVLLMGDRFISIDSGNLSSYVWARENWHLHLPERLSENRAILETLRRKASDVEP